MKKLILLIILLFPCLNMFAQEGKLKNVQGISVWAPANIKVDGNLKEWDDTFQAYNKTTKLFYTVSNDDKYIYLVVKSIDIPNNAKIISGGITLTINTEGKKKDKGAYSLTYPVIERAARQRGAGGRGGLGRQPAATDSAALAAQHKQIVESSKEIRVLGFKEITDTLISIYNEYSIKAAIGYDAIGNYDYEVAIPLKLLNISTDNPKEIAYNIKINGIQMPANFGGGGDGGGGGFGGGGGGGFGGGGGRGGNRGGSVNIIPGGRNDPEMYAPIDFWGKYILAKK